MDIETRLTELEGWARQRDVDPPSFNCRYYEACDASAAKTLRRGATCRMSYVGDRYGASNNGEAFRLVIIGIDHGEDKGGTYRECKQGLESYYQLGHDRLNPHYKGVVKTAAAVFGIRGEYCKAKCTLYCQKPRDLQADCVIDRIVQPNNVKCAPHDQQGRTSRATWPMKENCAHHLGSELRVLKPDLVVFHGAHARWAAMPTLIKDGLDMEPVEEVKDNHGSVLFKSVALGAHVLFLHHPSRNWLDRQWTTVVEPALAYLRARNLIPGETRPAVGAVPIEVRTRDIIGNIDDIEIPDGRLNLICPPASRGHIEVEDVEAGVFQVIQHDSGGKIVYADLEALLAAGWTLELRELDRLDAAAARER